MVGRLCQNASCLDPVSSCKNTIKEPAEIPDSALQRLLEYTSLRQGSNSIPSSAAPNTVRPGQSSCTAHHAAT
ncbi:hypothetical protein WJX73_001905 [Symbiochloris irregularis]|uniref:Uncharacterized protein n=1 Tax=Symbiochloris irregularis TaxID=706552 RepID=A0AAW1PU37_9CHLO